MLKSLSVSNFRSFEHLELNDLRRVNIISGDNGSGKTSLLEAILVGARANPQAIMILSTIRSMPAVNASSSGQPYGPILGPIGFPIGGNYVIAYEPQFRALFDHIFCNWKSDRTISISYVNSEDIKKEVDIKYEKPNSGQPGTIVVYPTAGSPIQISVTRTTNGVLTAKGSMTFSPGIGLSHQIPLAEDFGPIASFFSSNASLTEFENVGWFSSLSINNRENEFLDVIRGHFKFVESIQILSPQFQPEALWASTKGIKQPLAMLSSGFHRFANIILGCMNRTGGVILIDEIENGVWHGRYSQYWDILYELALKYDNQVFVTSHSLECIKAALPTIKKCPEDFSLIRFRQNASDSSEIVRGEALFKSMQANIEIR